LPKRRRTTPGRASSSWHRMAREGPLTPIAEGLVPLLPKAPRPWSSSLIGERTRPRRDPRI
jgi:hypothetical protein